MIVSGLAESKKNHGVELLDKLEVGMDALQQIDGMGYGYFFSSFSTETSFLGLDARAG